MRAWHSYDCFKAPLSSIETTTDNAPSTQPKPLRGLRERVKRVVDSGMRAESISRWPNSGPMLRTEVQKVTFRVVRVQSGILVTRGVELAMETKLRERIAVRATVLDC